MDIKNMGLIAPGVMTDKAPVAFPDAEMLHKNQMAEVLKELFDEKKIYMIGDLTEDQIKLATRIYLISKMYNIPEWNEGLVMFIKLLLSKRRESRKEIIEAIKGLVTKKSLGERIKNVFRPDEGN